MIAFFLLTVLNYCFATLHQSTVACKSIHPLPIMPHLDDLRIMQKQFFQINFFIHNWRDQTKHCYSWRRLHVRNTCKNTCTNQNPLVVKVFSPLGQYLVKTPFAAMIAMSVLGRSLAALYSEMVKSLPILHVKIALVLPSLMGIVDGLQSSSVTMNVKLGSRLDFDWATQEHLFS